MYLYVLINILIYIYVYICTNVKINFNIYIFFNHFKSSSEKMSEVPNALELLREEMESDEISVRIKLSTIMQIKIKKQQIRPSNAIDNEST